MDNLVPCPTINHINYNLKTHYISLFFFIMKQFIVFFHLGFPTIKYAHVFKKSTQKCVLVLGLLKWCTFDKPPYLLKINEHPTNIMIRNMCKTQWHKMKFNYSNNTIPTLVICVKKYDKNSKSFMFFDGATFHQLEVMRMDAYWQKWKPC